MTNEEKQPTPEEENDTTLDTDEVKAVAESVPAPDEYPEGQAEEMAERLPEDSNSFEEAVVEAVDTTEELQDTAPVQAFDTAVTSVQNAIESVGNEKTTHDVHAHHGDTTVFMGKEYDIPVYTAVFMALGALTILEVLFSEIFSGGFKIFVLMGIAVIKAGLVVWFYMHLNTDSRIFAMVLGVPVILAILSILFLLAVPTGY